MYVPEPCALLYTSPMHIPRNNPKGPSIEAEDLHCRITTGGSAATSVDLPEKPAQLTADIQQEFVSPGTRAQLHFAQLAETSRHYWSHFLLAETWDPSSSHVIAMCDKSAKLVLGFC